LAAKILDIILESFLSNGALFFSATIIFDICLVPEIHFSSHSLDFKFQPG